MEFSGIANYHGIERGSDSRIKHITGKETYLKERTFLIEGEITLHTGHYSYNFSCNLPLDLPTSVESKVGNIRYAAKIVLDCLNQPGQKHEEFFTVIRPLNLNVDPIHRVGVKLELDLAINQQISNQSNGHPLDWLKPVRKPFRLLARISYFKRFLLTKQFINLKSKNQ